MDVCDARMFTIRNQNAQERTLSRVCASCVTESERFSRFFRVKFKMIEPFEY
jgi:hypothetical protein